MLERENSNPVRALWVGWAGGAVRGRRVLGFRFPRRE